MRKETKWQVNHHPLSRRSFLKLSALAIAPLSLAASRMPSGSAPDALAQLPVASAQPQALEGRWFRVGDDNFTQVMAVHTTLLHTGHILYFSGDETDVLLHNQRQQDKRYDYVRLFDCNSYAVLPCAYPSTDLFCGGHAKLADGRVVVAGGIQEGVFTPQSDTTPVEFFKHNLGKSHHDHPLGSNSAWVFDPVTRQWTQLNDMRLGPVDPAGATANPPKTGGRWYPTLLTLPSGEVLTMSGHTSQDDQRHINNSPEILTMTTARGFWWPMPPAGSDALDSLVYTYPRLFVLPDGSVFSASPLDDRHKTHRYDVVTGAVSDVSAAPLDPADNPEMGNHMRIYEGYHASAVLLPLRPPDYRPRVLICGGQQPYVIDLSAPTPSWVAAGARTLDGSPTRWDLNATLLPTGEVFVSGGINRVGENRDDIHAVFTPELYNPQSNSWSTLAPATVVRNYHSVAVLMPDGRVWSACSSRNTWLGAGNGDRRVEIFEPWYCAAGVQRPLITYAPATVSVNRQFSLRYQSGKAIRGVAILRTGSVTHCFNADQRYIELGFVANGSDELIVTAPPNANIALPGHYLLFILDEAGVPSAGKFIRIPIAPHWVRWFRLSAAGQVRAGSPIAAVSSVPGGLSLFVVDANGALQSSYYDPRQPEAKWAPWFALSAAGQVAAGAPIAAVSSVEGGISLFVIDPAGAVQSTYYDPLVEIPAWAPLFPLSDSGQFSQVTAVSTIPGGISLFAVDPEGTVYSSYYDPRVENPAWSAWFPLSESGQVAAGTPVTAISTVEGGVSLFVADPNGAVQSSYYDPRVENPAWSPWFALSEAGQVAAGLPITAVSSVPGGISLFVVDASGAVQSSYYDPRVENPVWSSWFALSEAGKVRSGAPVSAVSTIAGGISLFAVDLDGAVQSSYYDPRIENAQWTPWFRLSDTGKVSAAAADSWVTVVSSLEGSTSLFVADGEAAVQSTYYDPREGAYEDHTVSSRVKSSVGGLVQTVNAQVKANFPAGALPGDAVVALQPYDVPPQPTGEMVAIRSFALAALDGAQNPITALQQPITLTVGFSDEELAGLELEGLQLVFWDGAVWQAIPSQAGDHELTAQVDHLSDFALLSTVAPPPAPAQEKLFLPAIHPG